MPIDVPRFDLERRCDPLTIKNTWHAIGQGGEVLATVDERDLRLMPASFDQLAAIRELLRQRIACDFEGKCRRAKEAELLARDDSLLYAWV